MVKRFKGDVSIGHYNRWKNAPPDATFYAGGHFRKSVGIQDYYWTLGWNPTDSNRGYCKAVWADYEERPHY